MKSKVVLSILLLLVVTTIFYKLTHRVKSAETYLNIIDKNKFFSKLKNAPFWMDQQINEDFKDFKNKFSIKAVKKTYQTILKNIPHQKTLFIHYRVVNNKLYRYFPSDQEIDLKGPQFEKAIKTLTQLTKLPDLDFVYSDHDGTPQGGFVSDFYFTHDENQAPLLNRARLKEAKYVVLIPDYNQLSQDWVRDSKNIQNLSNQIPWENKKSVVFWRGGLHTDTRLQISYLSKKYPTFIDAGLTDIDGDKLEFIYKEQLHKDFASIKNQLEYKYLPVLDGYMCTYPGYQWRLLSNSVAFKEESNQIQYFYLALKPFEHYIPINTDLSDLLEKINWSISHDDECKKITQNANKFVLDNLLTEDIYAYLYKVLKNYSKYQNFSKKELLEDIKKDSHWVLIQNRKKANKKLVKD